MKTDGTYKTIPYHLGCTGWSMKEWVGSFYKKGSAPDSFLSQYASVFNAVEGNTTFYSSPSPETVEKWGTQVPDGFKFCFKFPREITHVLRLHNADDQIRQFLDLFEPIREKCGPFMLQFPDTFGPQEITRLERVLSRLPRTFSYAVEVRHPDFFDHGRNEHQLVTLLKSYYTDRIIFDTRKLHATRSEEESIRIAKQKKPVVPVRFKSTASRPVIRYVGTNDTINNESTLKEWAIVLADWIKEGKHPYMFVHTPDPVYQPQLNAYFHTILQTLIAIPDLPVWPADREQQLGLF